MDHIVENLRIMGLDYDIMEVKKLLEDYIDTADTADIINFPKFLAGGLHKLLSELLPKSEYKEFLKDLRRDPAHVEELIKTGLKIAIPNISETSLIALALGTRYSLKELCLK